MQKFILTVFFAAMCALAVAAQEEKPKNSGVGNGSGLGSGKGNGTLQTTESQNGQTPSENITSKANRGVTILSKPRAVYTDQARADKIEGRVILRITFKADGTIGKVKPISGLAGGLTQQAIDAAKKIKFQPATKNGKPYTVTRNVEYNFTIY